MNYFSCGGRGAGSGERGAGSELDLVSDSEFKLFYSHLAPAMRAPRVSRSHSVSVGEGLEHQDSLNILLLTVDPGSPPGAPLQVICRGAPCGYPKIYTNY